jgi:hypothetical protein
MNENDQAEFTEDEAALLLEEVVSKLGQENIELSDDEKRIVIALWSIGASADSIVYFFRALREIVAKETMKQVLDSAPDLKSRLAARRTASSSLASPDPLDSTIAETKSSF